MFRPSRTTAALFGAAVVAWTGLSIAAAPAFAHDLPLGVHNVLDAVQPRVDGITVQVVRTINDQLVVENRAAGDVEVLAATGEPFLRIGPRGVEANLNSPAWYQSSSVSGAITVPARAHTGTTPEWAKVSTAPSWGWFDHRLHPPGIARPTNGKPTRLASWTIPMRYDGEPVTARGHLQFALPRGSLIPRVTNPNFAVGVNVAVLPGRLPGLFLTVAGSPLVIVSGEQGEPLARVTATKTEINEASPTWNITAAARDLVATGIVDATSAPRWSAIAGAGRITWLEPRARYPRAEPPARVVRANHRATVANWSVPVTVDGVSYAITGATDWVPASTAAPVRTAGPDRARAAWLAAIGLGAAGAAGAVAWRRQVGRRRRDGGRHASPR